MTLFSASYWADSKIASALPASDSDSAQPPKYLLPNVKATTNTESRGEYGNVPLSEEEDIVQLKKVQSTSTGPTGILNHPALPVACYCLASIMMTVVNKYVVSGKDFNMTCLLLAIQSFVCVVVARLFKSLGVISFQDVDMAFPSNDATKTMKQFLSIPVFTIFKNLTIILIAYGEVLWFGGKDVIDVTDCSHGVCKQVLSSIIAAWADISHTMTTLGRAWSSIDAVSESTAILSFSDVARLSGGYLWMFANCMSSAAYVLTMRKRIKAMGFSDWDTMFYNNFLSIPVLVVFSFLVEDWSWNNLAVNFPESTRQVLLFAIAFSGAAAVGISYTTAWCLRATSSTTYSMVGALNKLPIAASGMIFFGDPVTLGSVSAVGCGFFAGIVYAVAKNNQANADKARNAAGETIIPLHQRKG
ncbi:hypothetical protein BS47DRAFT_1389484 [Hydnum rufescens UP504]|uniref:GDP-mannose transporter n=1 Tax=Hydnum rufescens UP504 TaxID=1448309 RepID=A0A9P6E0F8_9AGAM|nr:hypothetical protein BS47DRAFT_1389484 [Hydnum rufescens UP504]